LDNEYTGVICFSEQEKKKKEEFEFGFLVLVIFGLVFFQLHRVLVI